MKIYSNNPKYTKKQIAKELGCSASKLKNIGMI